MSLIYTQSWEEIEFSQFVSLYTSVGWHNYARDERALKKAFENSSFLLVAHEEGEVVGLLRSLSDDVSIHYLQDILVNPSWQKRGIGRELVNRALERFSHVRTHLLLTDDHEGQLRFYRRLDFENVKDCKQGSLNAFIRTV